MDGNNLSVGTVMTTITTNLFANKALNNQFKNHISLSQALEQLSSGMRINSAKHDAAGQAITNRMIANLRADGAVSRGIDDGISLAQTAEGGLATISELLIRAKELAVQAANGTLSDSDRASIQKEFAQISQAINDISNNTKVFGIWPLATDRPELPPRVPGEVPPLSKLFPQPNVIYSFTSGIVPLAYIPAGATDITLTINSLGLDDDIQIFTRDGRHLVGTPINGANPDYCWINNGVTDAASANTRLFTEENGFLPGATYNDDYLTEGGAAWAMDGSATSSYGGMTIKYSGDGDRYENASNGGFNDGNNGAQVRERIQIVGDVTEDLIIVVVGNGNFDSSLSWGSLPTPTAVPAEPPRASRPIDVVTSASFGDDIKKRTLAPTPSDTVSLGIHETKLDPIEAARKALAALDRALNKVDGYRSEYGSAVNTLTSAKSSLSQNILATSAARSRILDADYAKAASQMVRSQILFQSNNAVLVQANQLPQVALVLLKGAMG